MKTSAWVLLKVFFSIGFVFAAIPSQADVLEDFSSLGGNKVLLDQAKALAPDMKVEVVQERIVPRRNRIEIIPDFQDVLGGDAYVKTRSVGLGLVYHFNPRWSLAGKYNYSFNEMSSEGDYLINNYSKVAAMDWQKTSYMAVLNWYPIYGKFNFLDMGVVHFDLYGLAGYGRVSLNSGEKPTYTAGTGFGFWWSKHLTTRIELRYQTYKSERFTGDKDMNLTVASVGFGYLL